MSFSFSTLWSGATTFFETWKAYFFLALLAAVAGGAGYYGYKCGTLVVQTRWDRQKVVDLTAQTELGTKVIQLQDAALRTAAEQSNKDANAAAAAAAERERLEINGRAVFQRIERLTRDLKTSPQYAACVLDPQTLKELNGSLAPPAGGVK